MSIESVAATLAALIVVGGGLYRLGKWIRHLVVRTEKQDVLLFGDGTDEHPGLEKWQWKQDGRWESVDRRLLRVEAEMFPNHGGSLRDAVDRIEKAVKARP